jgi:STE24 endopeptidase
MTKWRLLLGLAVFGIVLAASAQTAGSGGAPPPSPGASTNTANTSAPAAKAPVPPRRFDVRVTPEMIRHSRIGNLLYFVGTLYSLGVLVLVLGTRISARLRDLARRMARKRFLTGMVYFALLTLVTTLLELPLTIYGDYVVPHQFDLSDQSFAAWLGDFGKELLVSIVLGSLVAALALFAIQRFRRWWVVLWLGSVPLIVIGVVIWPLFIDPLFNKFEPLRDPVLKRDLLDLASRVGIEGGRVYQVNKSKQTKTMNAYVTGVGPSKRIVMWDTTLAKLDHDEILAVMAHEMGHFVLHHLWQTLAFGLLVSLVVTFLGQRFYEQGLARWGARWGIEPERGDPAALPWLLVVTAVIGFFLSPVSNGFSRHLEHRADLFGLEQTHLNEPMASAFVKLAEDSKSDPNPNRFIEFWRYSHPALGRRIEFALHYKPSSPPPPTRR